MSHSIAYLIEFTASAFEIITIESQISKQINLQPLTKTDSLIFNTEQRKLLK